MADLWSQPGVPHKGWRCISVDDLLPPEGGDYEPGVCEMCHNEKLRFIHTMKHDDYPNQLEVGCVCAEKMAEGYDGKKCEQRLKNRAVRRSKWLTRKWRVSGKGNRFLNIEGHNIGLLPDNFVPGKWKWRIDGEFSRGIFDTIEAAKLALFDTLADYLEW